jgi:glycerol-3-phosphate dehydrogenase
LQQPESAHAADAVDLLVVGGGINGAGIARDAAGRGLKVVLCEQGDLGGATSSSSTKLIHGGLRYLEYYEFRLVREALMEREVLLRAAPHIIWPLRFVLPHDSSQRPAWMIRLGLFLYDHLGGRKMLPASRGLNLRRDPAGRGLADRFTKAFEYSDCWVEDARLVVLNAMDAVERGAEVLTRTRCTAARRVDGQWEATLVPAGGGPERRVRARALVNAAGPWVMNVLGRVAGANRPLSLRLVKGSHIVVPRLFEGAKAYIFQNEDRRIVFAIPYERDYTLIGTTDIAYDGDPASVEITADEIDYLCRAVSRYCDEPVRPEDVVWTYSGVRPLFDDKNQSASAVTRDYVFDLDDADGQAPLLSIFGGKITTYRRLAEHAMEKLGPLLGSREGPWTAQATLPGGDIPFADFESYYDDLRVRYHWVPADLLRRWLRAYGTRVERLIGGVRDIQGLGEDFGGGLYEAEADYLVRDEWALSAADILWRRSKLGLHVPEGTEARLSAWLESRFAGERHWGT